MPYEDNLSLGWFPPSRTFRVLIFTQLSFHDIDGSFSVSQVLTLSQSDLIFHPGPTLVPHVQLTQCCTRYRQHPTHNILTVLPSPTYTQSAGFKILLPTVNDTSVTFFMGLTSTRLDNPRNPVPHMEFWKSFTPSNGKRNGMILYHPRHLGHVIMYVTTRTDLRNKRGWNTTNHKWPTSAQDGCSETCNLTASRQHVTVASIT